MKFPIDISIGVGSASETVTFASQNIGTSSLILANRFSPNERVAWSFVASASGNASNLYLYLGAVANGVLDVLLQADSAGDPSGTTLTTFSYDISAIPGTNTGQEYQMPGTPQALVSGTKYWLVATPQNLTTDGNVSAWYTASGVAANEWKFSSDGGATWGADNVNVDTRFRLTS